MCSFSMLEQVRLCDVWPMQNWPEASFVFASDRSLKVCYDRLLANTKLAFGSSMKTHAGLEDCLNMLLSCFRERMSEGGTREHCADGG